MNIFEFIFFVILVCVVMVCSRRIGRVLGMPDALVAVALIAILALLVRLATKIPPRVLLYLSALLAAASILSLGVAIAFPESMLIAPIIGGGMTVVIGGALSNMRRKKAPKTDKT